MYVINKNIDEINFDKNNFKSIHIIYDLKGSTYDIEACDCKQYFFICVGKSDFEFTKNNENRLETNVKAYSTIYVDSNVKVKLKNYSPETKIVQIKESN